MVWRKLSRDVTGVFLSAAQWEFASEASRLLRKSGVSWHSLPTVSPVAHCQSSVRVTVSLPSGSKSSIGVRVMVADVTPLGIATLPERSVIGAGAEA